MFHHHDEDISTWAGRVDTLVASLPESFVSRVVVVDTTDSTQDAALRFAQGQPGLLVVASRQNNGRGSHGRRWDDGDRSTLPCTFTLAPRSGDHARLAACVACAVHETVKTFVGLSATVGIKWPNDIVVTEHGDERKLSGILIEQRDGLVLVGVGINCYQSNRDWADGYASQAVSLRGLGLSVTRFVLLGQLVTSLSAWLSSDDEGEIRSYFRHYDAMVGTRRTFEHNREVYTGVVEHIDPLESITLRTESGLQTLPVAQTQHVRTAPPRSCS